MFFGSCFREGINIFLAGFVPTENLRFREESLTFKVVEVVMEEEVKKFSRFSYPTMNKTQGGFHMTVSRWDTSAGHEWLQHVLITLL